MTEASSLKHPVQLLDMCHNISKGTFTFFYKILLISMKLFIK